MGNLNCKIDPKVLSFTLKDKNGKEILNVQERSKYFEVINCYIGELFRTKLIVNGWGITDLVNEIQKNDKLESNIIYRNVLKLIKADADKFLFSKSSEKVITKILDNWSDIINVHKNSNSLFTTKAVLIESENVEDETDFVRMVEEANSNPREFYDGKRGNEYSTFDLMSNELRTLVKLIPKQKLIYNNIDNTVDISMFRDSDGLPVPSDSEAIFNLLSERLADVQNFKKFKEKLTSIDLIKVIPEVKVLIEMLGLNEKNHSIGAALLISNFFKVFSRPMISIYISELNKKAFRYFKAVKGNKRKIEEQFKANFFTANIKDELLKTYTIVDDGDKGLGRRKLVKIPEKPGTVDSTRLSSTLTPSLDFLELIGFKFSGVETLFSESEKSVFADVINNAVTDIHNSLTRQLESNIPIYEPWKQLSARNTVDSEGFMISSVNSALKALVDLESKYSNVSPTLSSKTSTDEIQHEISLPNQITVSKYHLNNSSSIDELVKTAPFTNIVYDPLFKVSMLRKILYKSDGTRNPKYELTLRNYNGFIKDGVAYQTADLSKKNKLILDILNMTQERVGNTMQLESKQSIYSMSLMDNNNGRLISFFDEADFSKRFGGLFESQMFEYLNAELERIHSYDEKLSKNPRLDKYTDGNRDNPTILFKEFSIFSDIFKNNLELQKLVLAEKKVPVMSELGGKVREEIQNYFNKEADLLKKTLQRDGLTIDNLISDKVSKRKNEDKLLSNDSLIRMFIANTFVSNIEFAIMIAGDPMYAYSEYHKRLGGLASTGNLTQTDSINEYLNSDVENKRNRIYSLTHILASADPNYSKLVLRNNSINNDFQSAVIADVVDAENSYSNSSYLSPFINSLKLKDVEIRVEDAKIMLSMQDALRVKASDGQGLINLDFHRELSIRHGFWNENLENAYIFEALTYKKQLGVISIEETERLRQLEEAILSEPHLYGIPILKFTFNGPNKNSTLNAKIFDKFSLAPIRPSDAIKHPELYRLNRIMLAKQLGYVKFLSGTKVYSHFVYNNLEHLEQSTNKPDLLSLELLKEQLKTSTTQKLESVTPSQLVKLLFSNLFNEGVAVNPKVAELRQNYINFLNDLRTIQTASLFEKLGFEVDANNNIISFDARKLVERLNQEVTRQKLNSTLAEGLEIDEKYNLKYIPEMTGLMRQLMDYLTGTADQFLRRYKINQADFVLISNVYRNQKLKPLNYTEEGLVKQEVAITLTKEFSKLLKLVDPVDKHNPIGTLSRLNELLKDADFVKKHEASLTVFLSRVPIDGPHSMGLGVVSEFLFPTAGNAMQTSTEFMIQAGIDFDYDKEKVIMPSLTEDGEYVIKDQLVISNRIEAVKNERKKFQNKIKSKENSNTPGVSEIKEYVKNFEIEFQNFKNDLVSYNNVKDKKEIAKLESLREDLRKIHTHLTELFLERDRILDVLNKIRSQNKDFFSSDNEELDASMFKDMEYYIENENYYDDIIYTINQLETRYDDLFEFNREKNIKNEFLKAVVNENTIYEEEIRRLSNMSRMRKESTTNRILDLYSAVFSLPELFSEIVIPNSNFKIKELSNRNGADIKLEADLPKLGEVYRYLSNLNVFETFYMAKALISPFAIMNTFHQLMLQQGVVLNRMYKRTYKKGKLTTYSKINLPFLSKDQLNSVFFTKDGNEYVKFSSMKEIPNRVKMFDGSIVTVSNPIQYIISQIINATVDSNKDPYFAKLRLSFKNVNELGFVLYLGVPLPNIIEFINNPLIQKYSELTSDGVDRRKALKTILDGMGLNIDEKQIPSFLNQIDNEKIPSTLDSLGFDFSNYLSFDVLNRLKIDEKKISFSFDKSERDREVFFHLRVLASFISLSGHSQQMSRFKQLFDNDTTKVSSLIEIVNKEAIRNELISEVLGGGMFRESDIENFEKNSVITPFRNDDVIKKILSYLFPIISNPIILNNSRALYKEYSINGNKSQKNDAIFPSLIENDLIYSILATFGRYKNQNITEYGKELIGKYSQNTTLAERFSTFRKTEIYKELSEIYPVLTKIVPISHEIITNNEIYAIGEGSKQILTIPFNIQFTSSKDKNIIHQESSISQFYELSTKDFGDNTEMIHDLIKDFFIAGITQSQLTDHGIGYYKYIPVNFRFELLKNAFDTYNKLSDEQKREFFSDDYFNTQFKSNNSKYYRKNYIKYRTDSTELGKPYFFRDFYEKFYKDGKKVFTKAKVNDQAVVFKTSDSEDYPERTKTNASADATIAIAVDFTTAGELGTERAVLKQHKKYISVDGNNLEVTDVRVGKIVEQLNSIDKPTITLNIAGNGIYTMDGKYTQKQVDDFTYDLLDAVVNSPSLKTKIVHIRTGGQTGFDEAGTKAAIKLGIPTLVYAPKGWKFKTLKGTVTNEKDFKSRFNNTFPFVKTKIDRSRTWGELKDLPVYNSFGVNTMRTSVDKVKNFGNIFTGTGVMGLIQMPDVASAVKAYEDWILGNPQDLPELVNDEMLSYFSDKLAWIRNEIITGKLNGKSLLYMAEKGDYYSHADALRDIVNESKLKGANQISYYKKLTQATLEFPDVSTKVEEFKGFWTRNEVAKQTDKIFLFGDNTEDRVNTKYIPSSTQAVIRGLDNAIGIDTKKNRGTDMGSEINLTPKANIPQNLVSGVEAFGTKQEANEEIKNLLGDSPHSIDMIEAGLRTRTTRSVGEMGKYNIKVGDIVKQFGKSADGTIKNILTRVTAVHPKGTPGFLETWNKEGWTQDGIKTIERYKDGAAAIEFEVVNENTLNSSSYFTDADFPQFKQQVDEAIQKAKDSGKTIVIPSDGIGTGKAMLKEKAPRLFEYLEKELDKLKNPGTEIPKCS